MDTSLQKVFQCAGHALLSAQFMEKELALLLLLPQMKKTGKMSSKSEIQQTINKLNRMTFGQLIHLLKTFCDIDDLFLKLEDALDKRNRLAHHYFEEYRNKLDNIETHRIMREELSEMKRLFDEMFNGFHNVNFRFMKDMGICDESGDLMPEDGVRNLSGAGPSKQTENN